MPKGAVRGPRTAFTLTKAEAKLLALYRSGISRKEIEVLLGMKLNSSQRHIVVAIEKERLLAIHDKRESGVSSLSKARGAVRMEGTR